MSDLLWFFILLGVGVFLGIVNTLGGGASIVSWPILILFGLTPHEATGTTSIASLSQTVSAILHYQKKEITLAQIHIEHQWLKLLMGVLGSILSAYMVSLMSGLTFKYILSIAIFCLVIVIWFYPRRWLSEERQPLGLVQQLIILFLIGGYAGGFQAGMGILFLFFFRLGMGLPLLYANYLKVCTIFFLQIPTLFIFQINGNINWQVGVILGIGSAIGARIAVEINVQEKGKKIIEKTLLITSILLILSLFKDQFFA
jgi:uncharacterized membrane protein YfcA